MKRITLATLAQATEQQVFDQAAKHLLTQKVKSQDMNGFNTPSCMYRGPNGTMCAAGCFISDEEMVRVNERGENSTAWSQIDDTFDLNYAHYDLMRRLQGVHDDYEPKSWLDGLAALAVDRGLDASVLAPFEAEYPEVFNAVYYDHQ